MRICCLDLATSLGWSVGSAREGVVGYGVHKLPKTEDDVGRFLAAYQTWLGALIQDFNPREICFEAPILPGLGNIVTLRKLYGLAGMTELVARAYEIACTEANLSDIRMHFLGLKQAPKEVKGRTERRAWLKRRTVLECRARGYHVATDDEADSLALLSLRLHHHQRGYDMRAPSKVREAAE